MNRKKVLSFLMAALFVLVCAGMASAAPQLVDGYYQIGSEADLIAFRELVNSGAEADANAKLTADITLTENWTPIGLHVASGDKFPYGISDDYSYAGTFDGGGRTVSGLKITSDDAVDSVATTGHLYSAAGLFGAIGADGVVKNLTIADAEIDLGDNVNLSLAGALVGYNEGRAENVRAVSGTFSSSGYAGGVAGLNEGGAAIIINCTASGIKSIAGGRNAGGVVGYNYYGKVTNSTASGIGSITANFYAAGGVVGYNDYGTVTNSAASGIGSITATSSSYAYAGGVVGYNNYGEVTNSTASGLQTIKANYYAGGVAGVNNGSSALIANCMASGIGMIEADHPDSGRAGGVVGYNAGGTIKNSLLLAGEEPTTLSGDRWEGGVLGSLYYSGPPNLSLVQDCRYPSNVIFDKDEDKPIGNIPLADMLAQYNVTSYDVTLSADALPAIIAMIEQGIAVEVQKGKTYPFDVTTLPGADGDYSFAWSSASADIVTVSPATGAQVTLSGVELGTTTVTCIVSGDIEAELTCAVTVIAAKPEDNGGGSSSNCNALGFGFAALALVPFLHRRKR